MIISILGFILRGWERSWCNFLLYNSSATFFSNLSDLPKYSFSFLRRYNFVDTSVYDTYDLLLSVIHLPISLVFLSPKEHEGKDLNWCISEFPKISCYRALHLVSAYLVTAAVVQWYKCQRTAGRGPFPCVYREEKSWGLGHLLLKEEKKTCVIMVSRMMALTDKLKTTYKEWPCLNCLLMSDALCWGQDKDR